MPETLNLEGFQPGQTITCTVNAEPRAKGARDTILRLMRRDPAIRRGLKRAQELRRRRMHAYIRGGRLWYSREKAAVIAQVRSGNAWTMVYTPDIAPDLRSVGKYVSVQAA